MSRTATDETAVKPPAGDGAPYRSTGRDAPPPPPRPVRRRRWIVPVVSAALLGSGAYFLLHHRAGTAVRAAAEAPAELLDGSPVFPIPAADMNPAVPLAPLLALEEPDRLAVLEPGEGASNIGRGEQVRVRFNRPMVDGHHVGHALEVSPLRFDPPVRGRATWVSRSTLAFEPEVTTWDHTVESHVTFDPALRSLAGEALADDTDRTAVFDGTPQLVNDSTPRRVMPGEPLRLVFDGVVDPAALSGELMAYESSGGQRSLRFSLAPHGRDAEGHSLVDVRLARMLEPGAQVSLVAAPMVVGRAVSDGPEVLQFELTPRPRIEGFGCPATATEASACRFAGAPGAIVDIGEELRVLSTVALGALPADVASAVRVVPALPGMTAAVSGRVLTLRGEWAPGQVYEVRLGALTDSEGHALTRTAPLAVRSAGLAPQVRVATGRLTFERGERAEIRLAGVHLDRGVVRYAAVPAGGEFDAVTRLAAPAGLLTQYRYTDESLRAIVPTSRANRWGRGAFAWRDAGSARPSSMAVLLFDPEPAVASTEGEPPVTPSQTAFVQSTDLGVTVHALDAGRLVWVTSIATGQPVANAAVDVQTHGTGAPTHATTDASGVAWIPASALAADQVTRVRVTAGDDRAIVVLDPRTAVHPSDLGLSAAGAAARRDGAVASVYTDRGIYRAGETVHANALARTVQRDALAALHGVPVALRLLGPNTDIVLADARARLSAYGTAAGDLALPPNAAPGEYTVQIVRERETTPLASTTVRVQDFREPAFRVDLALPPGDLTDGDAVRASVHAAYPFGAPAAGVRAHWTLTRTGESEYPTRWAQYTFGPLTPGAPGATVDSGEVQLDPRGAAAIATHTANSAGVRQGAALEVDVRDDSGQGTSARRAFVSFPAEFEVGLHRGPEWLDAGSALDLDAVVIGHDGAPAAGRDVSARIVREGWHRYWEWSSHGRDDAAGTQGGYQPRQSREDDVVHTCALTSGAEPAHCTFTPARPGTYRLEVTTLDAHGHTSVAQRRVYIAGPDEHPDRDPPGSSIAVTPARRAWVAGERARLVFESPFPDAYALITAQREGVMHREVRRVGPGSQQIELELTREMSPNVFVGVTLVRPRTGAPTADVDTGAPDLRFGAAELAVRAQSTPLAVELAAPSATQLPGTDVPIDVTVRDAAGRPAHASVTLWAVDEGTLRLTAYTTPDPAARLVPRRAPAFALEDLRRSLVSRVLSPEIPAPSGDGGGESGPHRDDRERFDPTPLWVPNVATDAQGRAHATIHLPDRNAQYRVMAVVVDTGESVGQATATLTASRPVVLRSALPRAVTTGDTMDVAVFVHNAAPQDADVTVECAVTGQPCAPWHERVAAGADVRVARTVTVPDVDDLEVRFTARADGVADTLATHIPVRVRGRWARSESVGSVHAERDVQVAFPAGTLPRGGEATLVVASHPFVGFASAVGALEDAATHGVEPLASAILGLAAYSRLEGTHARDESRAQRARGEALVRSLVALQNASGGFGFWTSDDEPDPYLSAWATRALVAAEAAGWDVPQAARDRATAYLVDAVRGSVFSDRYGSGSRDEQALALRVLADAHRAEPARTDAVWTQRDQLSPFGLAQLALAMNPRDRRRDALLALATRRIFVTRGDERRDPSLLRWWDGSVRTLGAVLEAAAAVDAGAESGRRLASRILRARTADQGAWWGTTHETSYAMLALGAWARRFTERGALDAQVTLDGAPLAPTRRTRDAAYYTLPFARVAQGAHGLHVRAGGAAFYALGARWATALGPAETLARGQDVALHRVYETESGMPLPDGAHVHLGQLVRVRLFMYTEGTPARMVTLHDVLGGGFEAVDATLNTSPRASLDALLGMGPDDDAIDPRGFHASRSIDLITYRGFARDEAEFVLDQARAGLLEFTYAVRAAAVGTFEMLPARLNALYAPRFAARSTAVALTVDP